MSPVRAAFCFFVLLASNGCGGSAAQSGSGSAGTSGSNSASEAVSRDGGSGCSAAVTHVIKLQESSFEQRDYRDSAVKECDRNWSPDARVCAVTSQTPGELLECRDQHGDELLVVHSAAGIAYGEYEQAICSCTDHGCIRAVHADWAPRLSEFDDRAGEPGFKRMVAVITGRTRRCIHKILKDHDDGITRARVGSEQPQTASSVSCDQAIEHYVELAESTPKPDARGRAENDCHNNWGRRTKECVVAATSMEEISNCRTPGGGTPYVLIAGDAEASFIRFVDAICACGDMQCVEQRQRLWAREGAEMAKDMTPEEASAMAQKMEPLTKRMTECVEKIAKREAGAP